MGSKSDTDRAFADLDHALAALGDGVGHETWGPGPMLARMAGKHPLAQSAFRHAAIISINVLFTRTPARMIHEVRTLAPVLLGLLLSAEDADADELASLFKTVTVDPTPW